MMFLDCPAYLDQYGALRCGLPAEVSCRFTMHSTDGPVESAMISCPAGHHFCGPIESLTWNGKWGIAAGQHSFVDAQGQSGLGIKKQQRGEVSDPFGTVCPLSAVPS